IRDSSVAGVQAWSLPISHTRPGTHTLTHARAHTHSHTPGKTHTHTHTHIQHLFSHTHTHTHTHNHTHTHTHTHPGDIHSASKHEFILDPIFTHLNVEHTDLCLGVIYSFS